MKIFPLLSFINLTVLSLIFLNLSRFNSLNIEIKYSTPEETGGTWSYDDNGDIFITSPFLESKHSLADYLKWLPINDSGVKTLIYKGKSYHIGRKK